MNQQRRASAAPPSTAWDCAAAFRNRPSARTASHRVLLLAGHTADHPQGSCSASYRPSYSPGPSARRPPRRQPEADSGHPASLSRLPPLWRSGVLGNLGRDAVTGITPALDVGRPKGAEDQQTAQKKPHLFTGCSLEMVRPFMCCRARIRAWVPACHGPKPLRNGTAVGPNLSRADSG